MPARLLVHGRIPLPHPARYEEKYANETKYRSSESRPKELNGFEHSGLMEGASGYSPMVNCGGDVDWRGGGIACAK